MNSPRVLATDLDGTLLPLDDHPENSQDLAELASGLAARGGPLIYVTGRHIESVLHAIDQHGLPSPDEILCDVGSSLYERDPAGVYRPNEDYAQDLEALIAGLPISQLRSELSDLPHLRLQEDEKQGRFKLSFYTNAQLLAESVAAVEDRLARLQAPYRVIASVDPFNGDGLVDLLPQSVSKAGALGWWAQRNQLAEDQIVFAGDSGNDLAALTHGFRAIVVGNADRRLAREVSQRHRAAGWQDRLCLAKQMATSGVLEGCRWFELFDPPARPALPIGATPVTYRQTALRVWAPRCQTVHVEAVAGQATTRYELAREESGYFSGVAPLVAGDRYQFLLDQRVSRPDPASRLQPDGVHEPSQVVGPDNFAWTDDSWRGVPLRDLILYELHIGAFTKEGTFDAAIARLPELVDLGVTAVEVMPVAQTPGRWNWGYDGVYLFAVRNTYGGPEGFRRFVDACHAAGLAVILDVVYNHLGPEGNYLHDFGPYFSPRHRTPWGDALNYDDRHCGPVRQFFSDNVEYWLREYHLDGLRLDAAHFMYDDSQVTIHEQLCETAARVEKLVGYPIHMIGETNVYDHRLLRSSERACYDAIWSDCLMHSLYTHGAKNIRLTPRDYRGAQDIADALRHGYLFHSDQYVRVTDSEREATHQGSAPLDHLSSLVIALQTHDAVGNHPRGKRLHQLTSLEYQRAAAALVLLYPSIPLLFMGEESASESPFGFFVDFQDRRLRRAVNRGKLREYEAIAQEKAILPSSDEAFSRCQPSENNTENAAMRAWYRTLLALRREGLAAGWLTPSCFSASYDANQSVYSIAYDSGRGRIEVLARLLAHDASPDAYCPVEILGHVLCDSLGSGSSAQAPMLQAENHALVVRF
ncbi:MAG: malto-oligosyltrehalose trehalohydrolase [Planctomycetales bacterium]|nr:malto-oligosyltrehalose trehalohydrolase [Planctomycetales bacterium]